MQLKVKRALTLFHLFFKRRDAKVNFDNYVATIKHRSNTFICKIVKDDVVESEIVFDKLQRKLIIKNEDFFEMDGILELQHAIASVIFS